MEINLISNLLFLSNISYIKYNYNNASHALTLSYRKKNQQVIEAANNSEVKTRSYRFVFHI